MDSDKTVALFVTCLVEVFEKYSYVVVPSGSCAGMIKHHYPKLWEPDSDWSRRARPEKTAYCYY
jgi:Fe-S oxidoreductase